MTRPRWIALALLLGLAGTAYAQGGPGFFMAPTCSALTNPVTGSTVCWQTTGTNGWLYWNGTSFTAAPLSGPYSPTTFPSGAVLIGALTGAITTTTTLLLDTLTTNLQAAVTVLPYGTSTGNTGELRFRELAANGTQYVGFKAPDAITTSFVFSLPGTPGTNGQCFVTDGASPVATISFGACAAGGGSGITSLNALAANVQTFTNDTNVTIVSGGSAHVITWASTLAVARGGTGAGTFTANGALIGNGTSPIVATAAGIANTVLRVPSGGGTPAFGGVNLASSAALAGLMRTANLGTGTADSTTFLRGDQTYAVPWVPVYNFLFNSSFEIYGAGTSAVATGWFDIIGGTKVKNTTNVKFGSASQSITRSGGVDSFMSQRVDTIPGQGPLAVWQGIVVSAGCYVRAAAPNRMVVAIVDAVGSSTSSATNTLTNTFEWLTVSRTISGSAAEVSLYVGAIITDGTGQVDGCVLIKGPTVPSNWVESGWRGRKSVFQFPSGAVSMATNPSYYGGGSADTNEFIPAIRAPFKSVARNLHANSSPSGTGAFDLLRVHTVDSALGCLFPGGLAFECTNTVDEVEIPKGRLLVIKSTESGGYIHQASIELEEIP